MKNRNFGINIIFTSLFLIISALFLIYIFRDVNCREYFEGEPYSWKYGQRHTCIGNLNTNTELMNNNSVFMKEGYNRYENNKKYHKIFLQDPQNEYRKYCDIMNWQDLLAYRCLNKSPFELADNLSKKDIANTVEALYIYNEQSLYSHLLSKIYYQKNLLNGEKIVGPIYVCISQAPYLKYLNKNNQNNIIDKTLDARIDILNNRNPYYLEEINNYGVQSFVTNTSSSEDIEESSLSSLYAEEISRNGNTISSLYCQILIIYPLYDKGMNIKTTDKKEQKNVIDNFLNTTMESYYTDNDLCNIRCNKSTQLNCGCLSYNDKSEATNQNTFFDNRTQYTKINEKLDLPSYTSRCIDYSTKPGEVNKNGNFTMMYFVNPYADNYGDNNIIQEPDDP